MDRISRWDKWWKFFTLVASGSLLCWLQTMRLFWLYKVVASTCQWSSLLLSVKRQEGEWTPPSLRPWFEWTLQVREELVSQVEEFKKLYFLRDLSFRVWLACVTSEAADREPTGQMERATGSGWSKNSGVGGVRRGNGKRLPDCLEVILANRQANQEGIAVFYLHCV